MTTTRPPVDSALSDSALPENPPMTSPLPAPEPPPEPLPAPSIAPPLAHSPQAALLLAELRALIAIMPGLTAGRVTDEADEADFDNMPV